MRLGYALILVVGIVGCGGVEQSGETEQDLSTPIPLYKLHYSRISGGFWTHDYAEDYLYTTNYQEVQNAQSQSGYGYMGIAGTCAATHEPNTSPLYRLYSAEALAHFYTTDAVERQNALNRYHYRDEGIACYVYTQQMPGTCPFYRYSTVNDYGNPITGLGFNFLYTMSRSEEAGTYPLLGKYHLDGIAAFMPPYNTNTCPN